MYLVPISPGTTLVKLYETLAPDLKDKVSGSCEQVYCTLFIVTITCWAFTKEHTRCCIAFEISKETYTGGVKLITVFAVVPAKLAVTSTLPDCMLLI